MLSRTPPPVEIMLTPEELAREFCEMSSSDHAKFFIEVGKIVTAEFGGRPGFETQMVFAAEELRTADELWAERALEIMQTIGSVATR